MNPHELAEKRLRLSAEYSRLSEIYGEMHSNRPLEWLKLRETAKTDKQADILWQSSEMGQKEAKLKYKLKGMEKEISGIKSYLDVLTGESRNQW